MIEFFQNGGTLLCETSPDLYAMQESNVLKIIPDDGLAGLKQALMNLEDQGAARRGKPAKRFPLSRTLMLSGAWLRQNCR
jgi:hypothetical protein